MDYYDPNDSKKKQFRDNLISNNINFLNNKLYLEFGVMGGNSMIDFYNLYQQKNKHLKE